MKLYNSGVEITEEDLLAVEENLRIKFPADYKAFIIKSNGGTPIDNLMFDFIDVVTNDENNSDIREFFIFYKEENQKYDNIMTIYHIMQNEEQIGRGYFPIADDSGGNTICICVSGEDYGKVYFCDHELEDAETGHLVMSKISNSFTEFVDNLYILTDDE